MGVTTGRRSHESVRISPTVSHNRAAGDIALQTSEREVAVDVPVSRPRAAGTGTEASLAIDGSTRCPSSQVIARQLS